MSWLHCDAHPYVVQGCQDCFAVRHSAYLRTVERIRREQLTPAEQGDMEALRDRYAQLGPEDRYAPSVRPVSAVDELDRFLQKYMRGEVDA